MPLVRLSVENYRCFSKRQELELPSITVVLGRNNAGKSALVRAPLVLSTGIRTDSPLPLDLGLLGDSAPDFVDLVHKRLEHGSVTVGCEFTDRSGPPVRLQATVQNIAEWHTQLVSRWSLQVGEGTATLEWLSAEAEADPGSQVYGLTLPGASERRVVPRFEGLLPIDPVGGPEWRPFGEAVDRIRRSMDHIRLMGPFRTRPSRIGRVPARAPSDDGELGRDSAVTLIHDHVRRGGTPPDEGQRISPRAPPRLGIGSGPPLRRLLGGIEVHRDPRVVGTGDRHRNGSCAGAAHPPASRWGN